MELPPRRRGAPARREVGEGLALRVLVGNREGRDDVRRSARVLVCAVGAALGESSLDHKRSAGATSLTSDVPDLPPDDRYRCRLIFQYRDVWEPILVDS